MKWLKTCFYTVVFVTALWASGIVPAVVPQAVPTAFKQGNSTKFQLAGTNSGTLGNLLCNDASGNVTDAACGGAAASVPFSGVTAGNNANALVVATGGSFLSSGTGIIETNRIRSYTVATLPGGVTGNAAYVTDGASSTDCTAGSGSTKVLCVFNGSAYVAVGNAGSVTSVDGTVALGVESIQGGVLAAITGSGSLRAASLPNLQTGTTYTVLTGDRAKLVTHTNGSAIAVTLPQANSTTFAAGWFYCTQNRGAGTVTITPTTSTIDGVSSVALLTAQGGCIYSDGTNYFTNRGGMGSTAGVSLAGTNTWTGAQTFSHSSIPATFGNMDIVMANGHDMYFQGNSQRALTWADGSACGGSTKSGASVGINLTGDCPTGTLDVQASSVGSFGQNLFGILLNATTGTQTGNNSSVTGSVGGPITAIAGRGTGFNSGSSSVGGIGGGVTLTAGQGGDGSAGHTNGAGGSVAITAGAPGAGAGAAGVAGKITLKGQTVFDNASGSTTIATGSLAAGSNDMAGKITSVTGAFSGVITFAKAWARAPACVVNNETTAANIFTCVTTTTTATVAGVSGVNDVISYIIMGY